MSLRKENFAPGEYYHIYNRGTDKRKIFMNKRDYEHFIFLMYICNSEKSIELRNINKKFDRGETITDIGAYCLMPNHFHILVREKIEGGISKYMRKLMTAYTMYFNKRYERTGKLYEGVFKSVHVNSDRYLKYMYSYTHLNPCKLLDKGWRENKNRDTEKLLNYAFEYQYSSLKEYAESKFKILNPRSFPNYFEKPIDYKKEIWEWLNFQDK